VLRIALQRRGAALPNLAGVAVIIVVQARGMRALRSRTPAAPRVARPFDA
jgi:hypothetical protein